MREALVKLGLDSGRLSVGSPVKQGAKDNQVSSKMSLGAGKAVAAAPVAEPAAATP
jgi:hypothetical protein